MRRSWVRPPWVSLRKRMTRSALTSRTFLTVWSFSCRYSTRSVQQGPGGGRCAARCRHGQKGGRRCGGGYGDDGCGLLLERGDHGSGGGICDTEALGQRREQCRQQDVNPLIGLALDHAEEAPVHHLEGVGFEIDEDEQEPVFRGREGAVFVDGKPARGPRFPIHLPGRHPGVERGLEGWDQLLKLVERQAGEIQERHWAGL